MVSVMPLHQFLGTILPTEKMFLGILLRKSSKGLHKIVQIFEGSPADDANLMEGTILLKVDHVDVSHLTCDELIEFTRRFEYTKSHLEIRLPGMFRGGEGELRYVSPFWWEMKGRSKKLHRIHSSPILLHFLDPPNFPASSLA